MVPETGVKMFAFMCMASVCAIEGCLLQLGMCCCCASRRDVRLGKKNRRVKRTIGAFWGGKMNCEDCILQE